MKILDMGLMPDGTLIQIEEWHEIYKSSPYASTVASYPISKMTHPGEWAPKAGVQYRFHFNFPTTAEARAAFEQLRNGEKQLRDYIENMHNSKYANCL